jgi:hypothetical protein
MDGGKSTSFIGHGTEQVVSDKKGGGYVIPINNAATRANPYLTDYNKVAAAGMGMPQAPEMFLGGLFKGAGNLLSGKSWGGANTGTGRDGGFGAGTYGSGWPSDGAQTQSPTKKPGLWGQIGNFLTKGDGQTSGAQMIGGLFGNERAGSAIGNIMGIFQGGGSGENGKATGWDIIKGIGGVAGNFLGGSKAGGWINSALGPPKKLPATPPIPFIISQPVALPFSPLPPPWNIPMILPIALPALSLPNNPPII